MGLPEALSFGALLISIGAVVYAAGVQGQKVKDLARRADFADAAHDKLRDRVDGLATKQDLREMEERIEGRIEDLRAFLARAAH